MDQVLIPNLMFEEELSGAATIGVSLLNRLAELIPATAFLLQGSSRCVLVSEDYRPADVPECLRHVRFLNAREARQWTGRETNVTAWGWSRQAVDLACAVGGRSEFPKLDAVIAVNQRQFLIPSDVAVPLDNDSHGAGSEVHPWTAAILFSCLCSTFVEAEAAIQYICLNLGPHWLIKSEMSQAGRNRIKGEGGSFNAEQIAWLSRRFSIGASVCVEPWVDRVIDVGIQYQVDPPCYEQESIPNQEMADVSAHGRIRCLGVTGLLTDRRGQYIGTRLSNPQGQNGLALNRNEAPRVPPSLRQAGLEESHILRMIDWGTQILTRAAERGYFGPAGIDAMIYRDGHGKQWLRPANDLNARFTMGRLALEISADLNHSGDAVWMFVPGKLLAEYGKSLAELLPKSVRMEKTSVGKIGQRPVNVASVLISSDDVEAVSWAFEKLQSLFVSSASSS